MFAMARLFAVPATGMAAPAKAELPEEAVGLVGASPEDVPVVSIVWKDRTCSEDGADEAGEALECGCGCGCGGAGAVARTRSTTFGRLGRGSGRS